MNIHVNARDITVELTKDEVRSIMIEGTRRLMKARGCESHAKHVHVSSIVVQKVIFTDEERL